MPRTAREKSKTGIYHVILRGINRQTIFEDEEDATKFIQTLETYRKESRFTLYAYCLMGNHIHLLMKEGKEDLGTSIKRIGASYVYWYNWKYERVGHLFQDRYKSEKVEDDRYFLAVVRYIHQNPLKAGLVKEPADYAWSSFNEFVGENKLVDTNFVLEMFSNDKAEAIEAFKLFHAVGGHEPCLDVDEKKVLKDPDAIELIKTVCHVKSCKDVQKLAKEEQSHYFKSLCREGLSARQIARITGVGRWMVLKAINN